MVKKIGNVRQLIKKGKTAVLALLLAVSLTPGFVGTTYAAGEEIVGEESVGKENSGEETTDADDDSYSCEVVENEDGSTTTIEKYYDNGEVTLTRETKTVTKAQEDGTVLKTVTVYENGAVTEIRDIEVSADGKTSVTQYKDPDGTVNSVLTETFDENGEWLTSANESSIVDSEGTVTKYVWERSSDRQDVEKLTVTTTDSNGNVKEKEETTFSDGPVVIKKTEYGEDGAVSSVSETVRSVEENDVQREEVTYYDGEGQKLGSEVTKRISQGDSFTEDTTYYDENGVKQSSLERVVTQNEDLHTEATTYYDADGNSQGTTEISSNGDGTYEKIVEKDENGHVQQTKVTTKEIDESGHSVSTEKTYDGNDVLTQEEVITTIISTNSFSTTTVKKDGNGTVLETETKEVTVSEDGNSGVIVNKTTDGSGKLLSLKEEYVKVVDGEPVTTKTISGSSWTDENGVETWTETEYDEKGENVRYSRVEKDSAGKVILDEESFYNADGTHSRIEYQLDENGKRTGSEETVYGTGEGWNPALKTILRDADGNLISTTTHATETDANGNTVSTSITYDAGGNLTEKSVVTINADWSVVDAVTTDKNGKVTRTASSRYTVDDAGNASRIEVIKDGDGNELERIELTRKAGEAVTVTVDSEGIMESEVKGLDKELAEALLTEEERTAYENGSLVDLTMETRPAENTVTAEEKSLVEKAMQGKGVSVSGAKYFDISVYKNMGYTGNKKVTDMGSKAITVTMDIPSELKNTSSNVKRTFYVVRLHDGAATVLAQTTGEKITFSSSLFSTYALAYHDQKINSSGNGGSNSGSNSGNNASAGNSATTQAAVVVSPKTGEEREGGLAMILMSVALAAAGVCRRKQRLVK